ncbi:signal transduction histidine kinase [Propionicimonas paludicola]|uniref:histidine kinase n=1 Tax=Propionicimonas paludicola TaxID=185243 RepID=A0A2A9CUX9_9ACTN|nr:HAMP domain-containing sensor histidine kinase [Propionicimonas paludicola]PFG17452.1 signal transduction histidine kinase [Propionicimonas paludicola]
MSPAKIPWWRSLGSRIALAVVAVTLAVLLPVGAYVDYQAAVDARERLRADTLNRLDTASALFRSFGQLRYSATTDPALVPTELRRVAVGQRETYFDGDTMWAVERLSAEQILAVNTGAATLQQQRAQLERSLGVAGLAAAVLGGSLGWLAGSRLSRRARRGAAAALRIAAMEPGVTATQPGRDEVAALTRSVDQLADALNGRIDRERAFTAYAAHELRTPVTALVSAAELLGEDEASRLVRGQAGRLRVLVADLLEISRIDSDEPAQLTPTDAAEAVRASLAGTGISGLVRLVVASSGPVLVEQRRLDRVLANVIANAHRHGRPPVVLTVDRAQITVEDHGAGFPDWLLSGGPRRFGADGPTRGHGLGLAIAQAQATAMGGGLSFSNPIGDDGSVSGARVTVTLAEPATAPSRDGVVPVRPSAT